MDRESKPPCHVRSAFSAWAVACTQRAASCGTGLPGQPWASRQALHSAGASVQFYPKKKPSRCEQKRWARDGGGWSSRAMVLPAPATLSRDAGARSDPPQDGQGEAGPPRQRRPPAFYSSVFAQVCRPFDEMPHRAWPIVCSLFAPC